MHDQKMVKPVPQDIAAANVGFNLVQMLLKLMLREEVFRRDDIVEALQEMAAYYRAPGQPERELIRKASAESIEAILKSIGGPLSQRQ